MQRAVKETGIAWKPGFWRHVPWLALVSLFGFIVSCAALAVVLVESDGKEVAAWPHRSRTVPVSVLLSLIVSVANLCLVVALNNGYEISWWTQALRGAELRKLQFDLHIQGGLSALLGRNRVVDKFAVAAVVSLIVSIADGPLIQRASTIAPKTFGPSFANTDVDVSNALLPANFSAFAGGGVGPDILTPLFSNISRAYANREALTLPVDGCRANTTCVLTLPAPGFDVSCTDRQVPYDFANLSASFFGDQTTSPSARGLDSQITTFQLAVAFGGVQTVDRYSTINTTVLYKADAGCAGNMTERTCVLRLATVGYPVTVRNDVATLGGWQRGQNETVELAQVPGSGLDVLFTGSVGAGGFQTMLGGVFFVLDDLYASRLALRVAVTANGYLFNVTGQAASNYLSSDVSTYGNCTMTWEDPTTDVVNTVRELMLRSAVAYSNDNRTAVVPQRLAVRRTEVLNAYKSHYRYLGATLAFMVAQALVVAFLLSGWRHLGRDVSLDAFEIARALGAPLLQGGSSNSDIQEALSPLRRVRLRYGELLPGAGEVPACGRGEKGTVLQAGHGARSHELVQLVEPEAEHDGSGADPLQRPRLGLDKEERVGDIRPGVLY
ncbi:hypothetical protein VTK73DRAFT_4044 [Phialemonium thermophilum]|uniref:Uncharacterized protein n=1 Tax=Phialemonium thermophilum TaxID=223376 RepID=A0ABR3WW73_9PEZI